MMEPVTYITGKESNFLRCGSLFMASTRHVSVSKVSRRGLLENTRSSRLGICCKRLNSDQSFTRLLLMYRTLRALKELTPLIFSIILYEIHSSSKWSPISSKPANVLMQFLARDNIFRFFKEFNPDIFSIMFVDRDNFLKRTF